MGGWVQGLEYVGFQPLMFSENVVGLIVGCLFFCVTINVVRSGFRVHI